MFETAIKIYVCLLLAAAAGYFFARRWHNAPAVAPRVISASAAPDIQALAADLAHANAARARLELELSRRTEALTALEKDVDGLRRAAAAAMLASEPKSD